MKSVKDEREKILDDAKVCVCGHRKEDYGNPEDSFGVIAQFWNVYLGSRPGHSDPSITAGDIAVLMALLKVARVCTGTGTRDSFVDLAGYAACGGEIFANRPQAKAAEPPIERQQGVYDMLLETLPNVHERKDARYSTDGSLIFAADPMAADALADILTLMGYLPTLGNGPDGLHGILGRVAEDTAAQPNEPLPYDELMGIDKLKTHQGNQPNEPLTLEELQEMEGATVWLECKHFCGWAILSICWPEIYVAEPDGNVFFVWTNGEYNEKLGAKLYRHPPKEDEQNA